MRLLQLNIERDKHHDRIVSFLDREHFDILCLEEVLEPDLALFEERYQYRAFFVPRALREGIPEGVAILSPHTLTDTETVQYAGAATLQEGILRGTAKEKSDTQRYLVAFATITDKDLSVRAAVTHFPWTPDGTPSEFQRASLTELLRVLKSHTDFVLCGDFNAPRGGEIWDTLASHYQDNIPHEYATSIDLGLHRAARLAAEHMDKKVVDGVFSTPNYHITNVERVCGLSDHCAFMADIVTHYYKSRESRLL